MSRLLQRRCVDDGDSSSDGVGGYRESSSSCPAPRVVFDDTSMVVPSAVAPNGTCMTYGDDHDNNHVWDEGRYQLIIRRSCTRRPIARSSRKRRLKNSTQRRKFVMDSSLLVRRFVMLGIVLLLSATSTRTRTRHLLRRESIYCHALTTSSFQLQSSSTRGTTVPLSSLSIQSTTTRRGRIRTNGFHPSRQRFLTDFTNSRSMTAAATTTQLYIGRKNDNRASIGGNGDPREFIQVQQALQADLRLAEQRQERLQREIQDAKKRQRRLRSEAQARQNELDQMRRRGLTRNARRLAREGSASGLDRERQLLEQELEEIRIRENNQRASRRLGTLGAVAIAAGAFWNFITEPDGLGPTVSMTSSSTSTTVKSSSSSANIAGKSPQAATLPYLEKEIAQVKQDLAKSKDEFDKERIKADEKIAIKKAEIEREVAQKKAQQEQEAARLKAEQEKEAARRKADQEKESTRIKAEQEAKAANLKDEQKAVEIKKAEDEYLKRKAQQEKEASQLKEEQAKEAARVKAEKDKEIARIKSEKESIAKKKAERDLAGKKKAVEAEQKLLDELETSKKKLVPPPAPKPAPAPAATSAPVAPKPPASPSPAPKSATPVASDAKKVSDEKPKAASPKTAAPKPAPAAKSVSSPKSAQKSSSPSSSKMEDKANTAKKEVKKVVNNSKKAVKNARKKADGWWAKLSKEEKKKTQAAVALSAGAATIAGVYNGLRDGTWSYNRQGVAGRWVYSPYTSYNRGRRRPSYGRNVNGYGGGGGMNSRIRGSGNMIGSGNIRRGNVNGLNTPVDIPGATGGPILGDDQQDLFSPRGGVFGGSSASQSQGYQNDMVSKLRRDQRGRNRNQNNSFQLSNPFAGTSSRSSSSTTRGNNSFQTPTRNANYSNRINVNARGTSTRSSPQPRPGGTGGGALGDSYVNGLAQQNDLDRGGFPSSGSIGQNQNTRQQPGGFTPPVSQSPQNRMQQPGGFTPPSSSGQQNQFSNVNQQRRPPTNGRSGVPRQQTRSNQRQQAQFSGSSPNSISGAGRSSPFANQNQIPTNPNSSSPFSNQGIGSKSTQGSGLGTGFSAGSGPTGGQMPLSGIRNGAPPTGATQSRQRGGLGQGFTAGNGPTGGQAPASGFSNPFSANGDTTRSSTGRLGQGFSPGNGSTGGNRVTARGINGSTDQGGNNFSPFGGGQRNQVSPRGSPGGSSRGRNVQQQRTGNQNSPFGGSPGGATAGFSPFGGNSGTNNGPRNVSPTPGSRFGSNGSPPARQQQYGSGGINGAGINGAGYGRGGGTNGVSGINGASAQQSGYSFNNNPSNPLTPAGGGRNDFERRRAQEQAKWLEEARREGIEEARREAQRGRKGPFGQSRQNNVSGRKLDKALENAIRTSDEGYKPPQVILDAPSIMPLLEQIDGPNLYQYDETEKTYSGRAVKVMSESSLDIPIRISAPGSIVEYTVEKKSYDFNLGITAKLDAGGTAIVKESAPFDGRQDRSKVITDQVLVGAGSVPCTLNFKFENKYTWMLEVTYRIRVIPPPRETLIQGRRRRTQAAIKSVETDLTRLRGQQSAATRRRNQLESEVTRLQNQMQSKYGASATPVGRRY